MFQWAATLLTLSSSPTAIRESATIFVNLFNTHNNVKTVLQQIFEVIYKKKLHFFMHLIQFKVART